MTAITSRLLRIWERDERLLRGRASVTHTEFATDESITIHDRLWVVCQLLQHVDEAAARSYAIAEAARVSHLAGRPEDQAAHARMLGDLRRIYALPEGVDRGDDLRRWRATVLALQVGGGGVGAALALSSILYAGAPWFTARDAAYAVAWAVEGVTAGDAAWVAAWIAALRGSLGRAVAALDEAAP